MNTQTNKMNFKLDIQTFADPTGAETLNAMAVKVGNALGETITGAELGKRLANASATDFVCAIESLASSMSKSVENTLRADLDNLFNVFAKTPKTMAEYTQLIENNLGFTEDYECDSKSTQDIPNLEELKQAYRIVFKKREFVSILQPNWEQAFASGENFGTWLNQLLTRRLTDTHSLWRQNALTKYVKAQFKNERATTAKMTDMKAVMTELLTTLAEGQLPTFKFMIGETKANLDGVQTLYKQYGGMKDPSGNSHIDGTKYMINKFQTGELIALAHPSTIVAMKTAQADLFKGELIDIQSKLQKFVPFDCELNEIYFVRADTIGFEQVLSKRPTQPWARNMCVDMYNHNWYKAYSKPWGIGFKYTIPKA